MYLEQLLQKYKARNISTYRSELASLKSILSKWAGTCGMELKSSGSYAKGTAISLASDVDILVSLSADCNTMKGLKSIYDTLYKTLKPHYHDIRKQNVSFRISLGDLEVDVTPARKQPGSSHYHWIYVSKKDTWQQTNIQKHILDISQSGRTDVIKVIKIWRERSSLDFPSIYLEYLIVNIILSNKALDKSKLNDHVLFVLQHLARDTNNPLNSRLVDPANSANILSDLLSTVEKDKIVLAAKTALRQTNWNQIVW